MPFWPHLAGPGGSRVSPAATFAAVVALASCSGSPTAPGPPAALQLTGIAPAAGSTQGGTSVTLTGSGFAPGATVTLAGVPATSVVVVSASTITAVAGPRSAGAGDAIVSSGGAQAVLSNAFTYVEPSASPNMPPVIASIGVQGGRPNQPAGMSDLGEAVAVTASVSDSETAPGSLTYQWSAPAGTFTGTGSSVTWQAPGGLPATPASVTLTLTVVETYVELNDQNVPVTREHRVTASREVRVHNSVEEVRARARAFLLAFSNSSIPTVEVIADFSNTCGGKAAEADDVDKNRCLYTIDAFTVGDATPTIAFGGICSFRSRRADACVTIPVHWESTKRPGSLSCPVQEDDDPPGTKKVADGLDQVTAIYEAGEWRLCDSDFIPSDPVASRFKKE